MISFPNSELILITGASSGIGKATALLCNKFGARVIAVGRDKEKLCTLKEEAKFPDNIYLEARDLTEDMEALVTWVAELRKEHGTFSGFVHCAGYQEMFPFQTFNYENSQKLLDVNYYSAMFLSKGISDKRNREQACSIVYISSIAAHTTLKTLSSYAVSKNALETASRYLSKELSGKGLRVNTVSPAWVKTPMIQDYTDAFLGQDITEQEERLYPLGVSSPEDIANTILFLLSTASAKITGQNIIIDGGRFL